MTSSKKKFEKIKNLWNQNVWAFSQPVNKKWNVIVIAWTNLNAANPAASTTLIYVILIAFKKLKLVAVAAVTVSITWKCAAQIVVISDAVIHVILIAFKKLMLAAVAAVTVSITWECAAQIVVMLISDVVTPINLKKIYMKWCRSNCTEKMIYCVKIE